MKLTSLRPSWKSTFAAVAISLLMGGGAQAANQYKLLHTFRHKPGKFPDAALVADSAGNLYGTTSNGINNCGQPQHCGVVFKLTQDSGGKWLYTILHVFKGRDGGTPRGSLIFDSAGNLYGTTFQGGAHDSGTVFELSPVGDKWSEKVLHSFGSFNDVSYPFAALTFDAKGNLYGTASGGGTSASGGVFELEPSGTGWHERVLHPFTGSDGRGPTCDLLWDSAGNLYGTTQAGGQFNSGVVFKLAPSTGGWRETVLYHFTGDSDGEYPAGGLIFDTAGNLYGTAQECRSGCGAGTVFTLTESMGKWTFGVLHAFNKAGDGGYPYAGLVLDAGGNLYGTTTFGGKNGQGTVFKLSPSGRQWKEAIIHSFGSLDGKHGSIPFGGVIFGPMGNLYGTADSGGADGWGVAFSLAP